jgi:hypothetical protein
LLWQLDSPILSVAFRKLDVAVSQEDYAQAASLRDQLAAGAQLLPAVSQYTFHQLQVVRNGALQEQLQAIRSLGLTPIELCFLVPQQGVKSIACDKDHTPDAAISVLANA